MAKKIRLVCERCGSDDVRADAYASWDVEKQDWVLCAAFDNKVCESEECQGEERSLVELEITPAENAARAEGWRLGDDGKFRHDGEHLIDSDGKDLGLASFDYGGDWEMLCSEAAIDLEFHRRADALRSWGFTVGRRDSRLNTDHPGRFMVVESHTKKELPTKDGSNGPWCIVGNDLSALVDEAYGVWASEYEKEPAI
jgi:hypothetical protein